MKIKSLIVENFRSLKKIKVLDFGDTTIFFGENNAGKSNLLSFLEILFKRKPKYDESRGDYTEPENFYEGIIFETQNDYFNNNFGDSISFVVKVEFNISELNISEVIKPIFKEVTNVEFEIVGTIISKYPDNPNLSEIHVSLIKIQNERVIYLNDKKTQFFPTIGSDEGLTSRLSTAFTKLINPLNDCVYFIKRERDMHVNKFGSEKIKTITAESFKTFLYSLYLSAKDYKLFEEINKVFSSAPFNFGQISFSKEGETLEIMIQENNFRLPIKSLGSGVLQTLFIISCIIFNKRKIVCIEELEQNLSPRNQHEILNKLKKMMKERNSLLNQIIISSHSAVYSRNPQGTIYLIKKVSGESIINKKEENKSSKELDMHLAPSIHRGIKTSGKWDLI